jgi:hypothetical protein
MKTKEVTQYICEHCNKKYLRVHACLVHEKMCHYNPENKTCCYGCRFLQKIEATIGGGRRRTEKKVFHCKKKQLFLHPPQYKNYHYDTRDAENVTMPLECSEFEKPTFDDFQPF